ncbi:MAG: type 2 lantipeptide synthetase LanM, partial [Gemmatimonadaceae bacterium]|nr:type 2 lantipeptide synthetase LanM [Gemmatimonadaceae bacterium]
LWRLTTIAAPVLHAEFSAAGGGVGRTAALDATGMTPPAPRMRYVAFVNEQLSGGLARLFRRHAALGRLLATRTSFWVDATAAMMAQLAADRDHIARDFGTGADPGHVTGVEAELSDSHNCGRMVSVLTFASGLRVVHKPRSLAPERAVELFIGWANRTGLQPTLSAPRVLDRGSHGWMEYVEASGGADAAEMQRFYQRAGMLACAMYFVGGKDLHSGNVIARDGHPLLVDLEMVMQPDLADEGVGDASAVGSWRVVHGSVLSTHLVPLLCRGATGGTYVEGGLARLDARGGVVRRQWRDVNTDAMALYEMPASRAAGCNVPRALPDGDAHSCEDAHLDALVRGFRRFYRLLQRRRAELLRADGPLAPFHALRVRLLLRSTDVYESLQRRSLRPEALATGVDRSIDFEALRRPFLRAATRHRLWGAVSREVEAMERGDVPIFHVDARETALLVDGVAVVDGYAAASGSARLVERTRRLGRADLDRQTHLLRLAWKGYAARVDGPVNVVSTRPPRVSAPGVTSSVGRAAGPDVDGGATERRDAALEIAHLLRRLMVPSRFGGVEWKVLGDAGLASTDFSLANGRLGIAFYLAALERATGADVRSTTLAAIAPLLRLQDTPEHIGAARLRRTHGIGGARGLGGMVYALTRISGWLNEPAALAAAVRLADAITERRIDADRRLDVFDGTAGALLGLLALHDATGSSSALERARHCARHLLRRRTRDPESGHRAWRTLDGTLTGGFAHGAAGIAYALGRLRAHGDGQELAEAIDEARAFEQSLYVPAAGNWASTTASARAAVVAGTDRTLLCGWCHGAAGIGLGRLGLDRSLEPDILDEIERAVAALASFESELPAQDHLCCGNAGRIELLRLAGERLGRPDLTARALACATQITNRARQRAVWGAGNVDDGFAPTLFFGMAGIGYELLRVDHVPVLPSVLLWE